MPGRWVSASTAPVVGEPVGPEVVVLVEPAAVERLGVGHDHAEAQRRNRGVLVDGGDADPAAARARRPWRWRPRCAPACTCGWRCGRASPGRPTPAGCGRPGPGRACGRDGSRRRRAATSAARMLPEEGVEAVGVEGVAAGPSRGGRPAPRPGSGVVKATRASSSAASRRARRRPSWSSASKPRWSPGS